jgi:pyrroloquinoline quinone biosynthesis protein B
VRVVVLGTAAVGGGPGGSGPEWSCGCASCQSATRNAGERARSSDSLAVSADGRRWFLLNVSPDVVRQIERTELLRTPSAAGPETDPTRHRPVMGAVLTHGDLDQYIGLLSLSESTPLSLYSTPETYAGLVVQDTMFRSSSATRRHELSFHQLDLDAFTPLLDAEGMPSGLSVCAFPVPAKACTS